MDQKTFDGLFNDINGRVKNLLSNKGREYATNEDKLINFRMGAGLTGKHPASVCWMYDLKHICSIQKLLEDFEAGQPVPDAIIKEKIGDYIAYGYLLYAILMERNKCQPITQPQNNSTPALKQA